MTTLTINSTYQNTFTAAKCEQALPEYRLVRKNGTLALQRAYGWSNGTDGGVEWRDEPTIDLDDKPVEL